MDQTISVMRIRWGASHFVTWLAGYEYSLQFSQATFGREWTTSLYLIRDKTTLHQVVLRTLCKLDYLLLTRSHMCRLSYTFCQVLPTCFGNVNVSLDCCYGPKFLFRSCCNQIFTITNRTDLETASPWYLIFCVCQSQIVINDCTRTV